MRLALVFDDKDELKCYINDRLSDYYGSFDDCPVYMPTLESIKEEITTHINYDLPLRFQNTYEEIILLVDGLSENALNAFVQKLIDVSWREFEDAWLTQSTEEEGV